MLDLLIALSLALVHATPDPFAWPALPSKLPAEDALTTLIPRAYVLNGDVEVDLDGDGRKDLALLVTTPGTWQRDGEPCTEGADFCDYEPNASTLVIFLARANGLERALVAESFISGGEEGAAFTGMSRVGRRLSFGFMYGTGVEATERGFEIGWVGDDFYYVASTSARKRDVFDDDGNWDGAMWADSRRDLVTGEITTDGDVVRRAPTEPLRRVREP